MPLDPLEYMNQTSSGLEDILKTIDTYAPVLVRNPSLSKHKLAIEKGNSDEVRPVSGNEEVEQLDNIPEKRDVNLSVTNLSCKLCSLLGKGSFDELQDGGKILDSIKDSSDTSNKENASSRTTDENTIDHSCSKPVIGSYDEDLEISEEEKATGSISFRLYWDYFRAGIHPVAMISVAVLFLATQRE
ncbi:hypothetical protein OS493_004097 [Desmophyllum pertusum]|uniref:Uncharacterized protein n=1 Tax=Desmophyllum pertusum TaxID=174260 RepID=A0A9X0D4L3_9CNID|nr:hypothetical protein OS493_004097 [Desmophyllum pertusum]